MKKTIYLLSLLFILPLASCNNKDEEGGADASKKSAAVDTKSIAGKIMSLDNPMVTFTVNIGSIFNKSNIKNSSMIPGMVSIYFDSYMGEDNELQINWDQNISITMFGNVDITKNQRGVAYAGFVALQDEEQFITFAEENMQVEFNAKEGVKVAVQGPNTIMAIKDNILGIYFSEGNQYNGEDVLVNALNSNTTSDNEFLNSFLEKKKDISMMYFYQNTMKNMEIPDSIRQKIDGLMGDGDIYSEGEINFENGKIVGKFQNHNMGAEIKSYMEHPEGLSKELAAATTVDGSPEAIMGLYSMNLEKVLNTFMGFIPAKNMAEMKMNLAAMGLSIDDVKNTMNGQFAFSMSNLPKMSSSEFDENMQKSSRGDGTYGKFAFAAGVKDKKAIEILLTQAGKVKKKGAYYEITDEKGTIYYFVGDDRFVVTSDKAIIDNNVSGDLSPIDDEQLSTMILENKVFAFRLNGSLFANMPIAENDEAAKKYLSKIQEIVGYGDIESSTFEFIVNDDSMNVLEYIVKTAEEAQKDGYLN